ncbi:hypothetical protein ABEB36_015422 [Hypothenemus hampei]|uniref:Uncharacterized protein n=1 Tax=Hypothenemus hampei TaxID=57062 RepID=A0ABD1E0I3_HYPHA
MSGRIVRSRDTNNDDHLVIDNVLTTQPELGPSIPDGGYGWFVFLITLFFQLLIPSLVTSFGIFLAFSRMKTDFNRDKDPKLWDHSFLYVPLFFSTAWTLFEPTSRQFIIHSTWPKLFAIAGTCLTCAGLLFVWIGMTGDNGAWLFVAAGSVGGIGSSIQMVQCDILLAQYFRLKLAAVTHLSHAVAALGFIFAPIILGHHLLQNTETSVILWYQAIILQGLVLNLLLRKPLYLKSQHSNSYNYVTTNVPDEEEDDILSKNSRELQIKIQNGPNSEIQRHELVESNSGKHLDLATAHSSGSQVDNTESTKVKSPNWVSFEDDEDDEETTKYERVQQWEGNEPKTPMKNEQQWETFEDDLTDEPTKSNVRNTKNLQLELSFGNVETESRPTTQTITGIPIPLFSSDTPVNNNTSYAYDSLEDQPDSLRSSVFMPTTLATTNRNSISPFSLRGLIELLQQPTFYKSLVTVFTTKWSLFTFYTLFPSFLLQEVDQIKLRQMSSLVGTISVATLLFAGAAYWCNVEKRWRAKIIWFLSWMGALGYFMISDYFTEGVLLFGAILIALSIAALQHVGTPLLGLTIKGEATKEFVLISILTGLTFLFFLLLNASFKQVFRLMALLNFLTGTLWLANYIYKRLR